ncbi:MULTISPECIES: DUF1289 domain-containing protein [Ectothiorhodospira]|uniref:DUF1289 domain-containing protein n=1 Tax=Ectothiorhodospira marina TaxID=1396821 RepID=A0A1H7PIH4_9GAMM|nr:MULTISPECIES: DUF1289 domain-containing protein [Ectothiorhodospira]MCG5516774.1 DUF1289 domain-containing protein [Ectothiorhodospira sp. 9100]MCG5518569.1 DUF1289 domain-containing protein [Ectothiorhodospira sp. 9905]SEL34847.1 hypothetical protein SAMN05444515_11418 [Ectothiorhodospira marina]
MQSPCIHVCQTEEGRCIGCGRTLMEIAAWTRFTDRERKVIMERLREEGYGDAPSDAPVRAPRPQAANHEEDPKPAEQAGIPRNIQITEADRRRPESVCIDGIRYGEQIVDLVKALQGIAQGGHDAATCRSMALQALQRPAGRR